MDQFQELARALNRAGLWAGLSWVRRRRLLWAVAAAESGVVWPGGGAWRADGEDLAPRLPCRRAEAASPACIRRSRVALNRRPSAG